MADYIQILNPHNYILNPYAIPSFIVGTLVLIFGFLIRSLEKKSCLNRSFLYLCASYAVWLYAYSLVLNSQHGAVALFWSRILYVGLILVPVNIFHVTVHFTESYPQERSFVRGSYVTAFVFIILMGSTLFLSGVREYFWGFYPEAGRLHPILLLFIFSVPLLGFVKLISHYRSLSDAFDKKRAKYLAIAFIFILLSYVDVLPGYGIGVYPFGYLAVLGFIVCMMYSIIKYRNLMVERHARELEHEVEGKTQEISQVLEELRTTQLKLLETGKISVLASLSAGILHQISQPITAIHGFVRFIHKEMKETDPFYRPIALMEEQSVYLKDMLEDLMELIRHREIKKENIDVNACVKRAANLLTDELRIRRIDWDLILDDHIPQAYADTVHLQQIFMNIIVNAMQAMSALPKGSRRHMTIVSRFDKDANKIVIAFKDTGPGIPPELQQQIFEPFFSTKIKGSGIGLALCKDLIAEHGGDVTIESQPNQGATFIIWLPPVDSAAQSNLNIQKI